MRSLRINQNKNIYAEYGNHLTSRRKMAKFSSMHFQCDLILTTHILSAINSTRLFEFDHGWWSYVTIVNNRIRCGQINSINYPTNCIRQSNIWSAQCCRWVWSLLLTLIEKQIRISIYVYIPIYITFKNMSYIFSNIIIEFNFRQSKIMKTTRFECK